MMFGPPTTPYLYPPPKKKSGGGWSLHVTNEKETQFISVLKENCHKSLDPILTCQNKVRQTKRDKHYDVILMFNNQNIHVSFETVIILYIHYPKVQGM